VFTPALVFMGYTLTDQTRFGWEKDRGDLRSGIGLRRSGSGARPGCGEAYTIIGYVRTFQRRHDEAVAAAEKAISLSPSGADAIIWRHVSRIRRQFPKSCSLRGAGQRLSPVDSLYPWLTKLGQGFILREFTSARDTTLRVLTENRVG